MDISKTISATSTAPNTAPLPPKTPDQLNKLSDLNLQTNQPQQARVVGSFDALYPNHSPAINTAPNVSNELSTEKEWILQIQGKFIRVATSANLEASQPLSLKLDNQNFLVMENAPKQPALNPANIESKTINVLLSAMNRVITQQLSLNEAISSLQQASKSSTSSPEQIQAKVLLSFLAKQLPADTLFKAILPLQPSDSPLNSAKSENSHPLNDLRAAVVETVLKRSGLGFEKKILSATKEPAVLISDNFRTLYKTAETLSTRLEPIQQAFNSQANDLKHPLAYKQGMALLQSASTLLSSVAHIDIPSTSTIQSLPTAKQNASLPALTNEVRTAIQNLKDLLVQPGIKQSLSQLGIDQSSIEQVVKNFSLLANTSTAKTTPLASSLDHLSGTSDVKGMLLNLGATLATDTKDKNHSLLEGFTSPRLTNSPFNFPPLHQPNIAKANSILADQDLSTGQLLKLVASMINRIQFNQLNSIYQSQSAVENAPLQSWIFEIPVASQNQHITTFDLRIDKESESNEQSEDEEKKEVQWRITLSFNLEELGEIYIQVALTPPNVSSVIWADNNHTLDLIKKESKHLKQQLDDLGLDVGDILCQQGRPKQTTAKLDRSLVDVKA